MAYKYKNILNLQGDDFAIRTVIHGIQHAEFGCGSIDFNMITPMPPWVSQGADAIRESWCKAHWGVTGNASGLEESVKTYDGGDTVEFDTQGGDVRELMRLLSLCFLQLSVPKINDKPRYPAQTREKPRKRHDNERYCEPPREPVTNILRNQTHTILRAQKHTKHLQTPLLCGLAGVFIIVHAIVPVSRACKRYNGASILVTAR